MEISSWPWALFIFKALIILRSSFSLKSKTLNSIELKIFDLLGVNYYCLMEYIVPQKTYKKIFAFICISVTNLSSTKRGGISGIFFVIVKCF